MGGSNLDIREILDKLVNHFGSLAVTSLNTLQLSVAEVDVTNASGTSVVVPVSGFTSIPVALPTLNPPASALAIPVWVENGDVTLTQATITLSSAVPVRETHKLKVLLVSI